MNNPLPPQTLNPDQFFIGHLRTQEQPVQFDPKTLLRHMVALGSSGSGKTVLSKVLIEEFVRHGIPAICVDPQGDIGSLALLAEDPSALADYGVDPHLAEDFAERGDRFQELVRAL